MGAIFATWLFFVNRIMSGCWVWGPCFSNTPCGVLQQGGVKETKTKIVPEGTKHEMLRSACM